LAITILQSMTASICDSGCDLASFVQCSEFQQRQIESQNSSKALPALTARGPISALSRPRKCASIPAGAVLTVTSRPQAEQVQQA
jgi:hypothetical protein